MRIAAASSARTNGCVVPPLPPPPPLHQTPAWGPSTWARWRRTCHQLSPAPRGCPPGTMTAATMATVAKTTTFTSNWTSSCVCGCSACALTLSVCNRSCYLCVCVCAAHAWAAPGVRVIFFLRPPPPTTTFVCRPRMAPGEGVCGRRVGVRASGYCPAPTGPPPRFPPLRDAPPSISTSSGMGARACPCTCSVVCLLGCGPFAEPRFGWLAGVVP